jgi:hypothetical protein
VLAYLSDGTLCEKPDMSNLLSIRDESGKEIFFQKGLNPKLLPVYRKGLQYSEVFCDVICSRVAGGESLRSICLESGMPSYAQICRWKREHAEFREALKEAYEDYADYIADKVVDVADPEKNPLRTKERVAQAGLFVDTLKWKAQVHKPRMYSARMKVSGDSDNPIKIILETGIRRSGDPGFNADATEQIKEAKKVDRDDE